MILILRTLVFPVLAALSSIACELIPGLILVDDLDLMLFLMSTLKAVGINIDINHVLLISRIRDDDCALWLSLMAYLNLIPICWRLWLIVRRRGLNYHITATERMVDEVWILNHWR